MTFLGRPRGYLEPEDLETEPTATVPGLLIVRPDEALFFANATPVRDAVLRAGHETTPKPSVVLLDLSLTTDVDVPAVEAIEDLARRLTSEGTSVWLSNVHPSVLDLLERAGALDLVGRDRVYPRIADGILAFVRGSDASRARLAVLADLVTYLRERQTQEGTSPEGLEVLAALEARLTRELAAEGA